MISYTMILQLLLPLSTIFVPSQGYPSQQQSSQHGLISKLNSINPLSSIYHSTHQHPFKSPQDQRLILSPPSNHPSSSHKGVAHPNGYGTITMYAPFLHQSVKLDFSYRLSLPILAPSPFPGRSFRECSSSACVMQEANVPLIQELAIHLLDGHPQGVNFPSTREGGDDTSRGETSHRTSGGVNPELVLNKQSGEADAQTVIREVAKTMRRGNRIHASVAISLSLKAKQGASAGHEEDQEDAISENKEDSVEGKLMTRDEWRLVVTLLRSTAVTLKDDVLGHEKGFKELRLRGEFEHVVFDAAWKFWDVKGRS